MTARLVLALAALGLVAGCTAPAEGRLYGISTASVEVQRNALLSCRDRLGFAGQTLALTTDFRSRRYEENIYRLRVVAQGGIDRAAARSINACAEQDLAARFGTGRPMVRSGDAMPYAPSGDAAAPAPRAARAPVASGCRKGGGVMQGGSSYCVGS